MLCSSRISFDERVPIRSSKTIYNNKAFALFTYHIYMTKWRSNGDTAHRLTLITKHHSGVDQYREMHTPTPSIQHIQSDDNRRRRKYSWTQCGFPQESPAVCSLRNSHLILYNVLHIYMWCIFSYGKIVGTKCRSGRHIGAHVFIDVFEFIFDAQKRCDAIFFIQNSVERMRYGS